MSNLIQRQVFGNVVTASTLPFVSTWKTDNSGVSSSNQIKLPLVNGGSYNFTVDWGDGTSDTITAYNAPAITHTYSVAGTKTISITGTLVGWIFGFGGDRLKLLSISSWGSLKLLAGSLGGSIFMGCENLTLSGVTDTLDLSNNPNLTFMFYQCSSITTIPNINFWNMSGITSISNMFYNAGNFNSNIGSWNTSAITDMSFVFGLDIGNSSFNQNIGSWVVTGVTTFNGFMAQANSTNFSTTNLDAIYNSWSTQNVQSGKSISFGTAKYTSASSAGRNILTGTYGWTITDSGL